MHEAVKNLQLATDFLKEATEACRGDVGKFCGQTKAGQGRIMLPSPIELSRCNPIDYRSGFKKMSAPFSAKAYRGMLPMRRMGSIA
jgi:hypothetical protein